MNIGSSGWQGRSAVFVRFSPEQAMTSGSMADCRHSWLVHTTSEMARAIQQILAEMRILGFSEKEQFGTRLALEEAITNSIRHGHRGDTSKVVEIRFHLNPEKILIEIHDQGRGFDPDGLPDPLAPGNVERPGGRGVFLMRHYMTWVSFNEKGNCVTLCKIRGR